MTTRKLYIQQKFQLEILEISCAQWNGTFRLHRPDPSQRTFGYCSCKQDTKERYWGRHNFVKWKGTFRSDQLKWPDRSEWTTFKGGPEYSSRTKPKWLVPFDVPTEISGLLGWMKSAHGFINGMLGGKHDLACEQALLCPSRLRRSLARSRKTCFARPNRRACSQAKHDLAWL